MSEQKNEENVTFSRPFLIQICTIIVMLAFGYGLVQSDIKTSLLLGVENKAELKQYQNSVHDLQMQILSLQDDLKYFRLSWEKDANKYWREGSDKK